MTNKSKPTGRPAVMAALLDATIELVVRKGTSLTVREVADAAGVNHGLVHTYFGSKQGLVSAALDEINRRAVADIGPAGFPPPDLASRREGELAKAVAHVWLDDADDADDMFTSHPVISSWSTALADTRPDLDTQTIESMVSAAAALGLGWAVFADALCAAIGIDESRRAELDEHIAALVADLGGIPIGSREPDCSAPTAPLSRSGR